MEMPYRIVFLLVPLVVLIALLVWKSTRPVAFTSLPRSALYTVIGLLSLVLLQQTYMEYRWLSTQRTATEVAQRIAGPSSTVHCQRMSEAMFYAMADRGRVEMRADGSPSDDAMLTWEVCRDLRDWLGSDRSRPSIEQITALHILVHEAVHLTGQFNESATECRAMEQDAAIAESLGAPAAVAARMAKLYRELVHPRMPVEYRSRDCQKEASLPAEDTQPR